MAMVLHGLWPLLANAAPADFSAPVCSTAGTMSAPNGYGMPMPTAPAQSPAPHCPFCTFGADHSPALASATVLAFAPPPALARPPVITVEYFPSFVFPTAPPRGPPARLI